MVIKKKRPTRAAHIKITTIGLVKKGKHVHVEELSINFLWESGDI